MRSIRIGILVGMAAAATTFLPTTTASADPIEVSCPSTAPALASCGVRVDADEPLDPKIYAFFKGLDDPANGELMVEVGLR